MPLHATRREMLKWTGLTAGATLLPGVVTAEELPQRRRVLRLAHLTDMHIQPELAAAEGVTACLQHLQSLADKPDLILSGGDTIMDSLATRMDRTKLQWELWTNTLKSNCSIRVESCLGNHDIWGWNKKSSGTTGEEPEWGKKWACDVFGIERSYRSFDHAGWHFVLLDSMMPHEETVFTARIDDAQWDWLHNDLAATKPETPVLVLSHIPILSACVLAGWSKVKPGDITVSHQLMHTDVARLLDLFWKHQNVKLCLSGHLHLRERVNYNGVTYLCNGAVSGGWWKGDHQQTKAGYAIIDLFADGTFEDQYVPYGWQAKV